MKLYLFLIGKSIIYSKHTFLFVHTQFYTIDYTYGFRKMSGSDSLLFAWNLSKNVTVLDLSTFDGTPAEVNLSLCTSSACSILPAIK